MPDFEIERGTMLSGQYEAQKRTYKMLEGKSGARWMVAVQEAPASHIYVEDLKPPADKRWAGFGGSTLTFRLEDGSEVKLTAPWHSNADALFEDTGCDVREMHRTFVVVARGRTNTGAPRYRTILTAVLYQDPEGGKLGRFERGRLLAQDWANRLGQEVFYYSESYGGSSHGPVKPA